VTTTADAGSQPTSARPADQRGRLATFALLVLAWAVISALVVGWGWLLTHPLESSIDPAEDDLSRWFVSVRTPELSDAAEIGTLVGDTKVGAATLAVVSLGIALWRRSVLPVVFVVLVEVGLGGTYELGTLLVPRDRPPVKLLDPGLVSDHSYPSGHVGTATAIFACIAVLLWVFARVSWWWTSPLAVLPVGDLLARLYQGAHHLSDVLTSLVYAPAWIAVCAALVLGGRKGSAAAD
jgi:membrane-associated phospholipid phosphatase